MGREALRRTLWAFDGRAEKTALSAAILDRFGGDPAKIVRFASRATPALYAQLAPLVLQYASLRDPLAVTWCRKPRRPPPLSSTGLRMSARPRLA